MILCFSGTGNSRYVADRIASLTGDAVTDLNRIVKRGGARPRPEDPRLVFVAPTYAWRLPRVVEKWARAERFADRSEAWFVMTCGDGIGNAAKYNRRLCRDRGLAYMGTAQIVMPENYLAMFEVPGAQEAAEIVRRSEPDMDRAGRLIAQGRPFPDRRSSLPDRAKSGIVNPAFYALFVKADAFRAGDDCTGCGKCAALCPMNNIRLENGRPAWGKRCTHCMACICRCPQKAIEYGKKSIGKPRYHCMPQGGDCAGDAVDGAQRSAGKSGL